MAIYDKENHLWQSPSQKVFHGAQISPGQKLLNAISVHGSKVAQVN